MALGTKRNMAGGPRVLPPVPPLPGDALPQAGPTQLGREHREEAGARGDGPHGQCRPRGARLGEARAATSPAKDPGPSRASGFPRPSSPLTASTQTPWPRPHQATGSAGSPLPTIHTRSIFPERKRESRGFLWSPPGCQGCDRPRHPLAPRWLPGDAWSDPPTRPGRSRAGPGHREVPEEPGRKNPTTVGTPLRPSPVSPASCL